MAEARPRRDSGTAPRVVDVVERCRIMALHGISKDAWKRYSAEGSWYYEIIAPGDKYNMTDIAAGMGLAQFGDKAYANEQDKRAARSKGIYYGVRPVESGSVGGRWGQRPGTALQP